MSIVISQYDQLQFHISKNDDNDSTNITVLLYHHHLHHPNHLHIATLSLKDRKSQCDSKGMLRVSIINSLFAMKMMKEVKEHAKDGKDGEGNRKRRIVMKMALDAFTVLDTTQ